MLLRCASFGESESRRSMFAIAVGFGVFESSCRLRRMRKSCRLVKETRRSMKRLDRLITAACRI